MALKKNYQLVDKLIYQGQEHIDHLMLFYHSILQKYKENFLLYRKNVLLYIPSLLKNRYLFEFKFGYLLGESVEGIGVYQAILNY